MGTTTDLTRSAALFERAQRVLPGGVSRNTVLRSPHPAYADHGEGCRITDLDGVTRIDFSNNMCSLIHGHADADVTRAVMEQLPRGSAFMMATEAEVDDSVPEPPISTTVSTPRPPVNSTAASLHCGVSR